jgi:hypothetical protein
MPMFLDRQVNNQVPVTEDLPLAKTVEARRAFQVYSCTLLSSHLIEDQLRNKY